MGLLGPGTEGVAFSGAMREQRSDREERGELGSDGRAVKTLKLLGDPDGSTQIEADRKGTWGNAVSTSCSSAITVGVTSSLAPPPPEPPSGRVVSLEVHGPLEGSSGRRASLEEGRSPGPSSGQVGSG